MSKRNGSAPTPTTTGVESHVLLAMEAVLMLAHRLMSRAATRVDHIDTRRSRLPARGALLRREPMVTGRSERDPKTKTNCECRVSMEELGEVIVVQGRWDGCLTVARWTNRREAQMWCDVDSPHATLLNVGRGGIQKLGAMPRPSRSRAGALGAVLTSGRGRTTRVGMRLRGGARRRSRQRRSLVAQLDRRQQ